MARSYYEDLGIKPGATKAEIKSAYRKLVLLHHPDRSKDPRSKEIFLRITEAHEVLSDPVEKRRHDDFLERLARHAREEAEKRAVAEKKKAEENRIREEKNATPSGLTVAEEVAKLQTLFSTGRHNEAEKLAHAILQVDPRQAIPYAVLADILRGRGYKNEAGKMYAYAAQMDPKNATYQRRYEQLLNSSQVVTQHGNYRLEAEEQKFVAPAIGGGFIVIGGVVVALSQEASISKALPFVSSWTASLVLILFLSGVAVGASLAVGNLVDRFVLVSGGSSGRASPTAILGLVAIVNFWVSGLLYLLIAIGLKAFNYSTTRLMAGVGAATVFLSIASMLSHAVVPAQTFFWGGNIVYVGSLLGWMTVDAIRGGE